MNSIGMERVRPQPFASCAGTVTRRNPGHIQAFAFFYSQLDHLPIVALMRTLLATLVVMICYIALGEEPFLKESKKVVARQEWNREIVTKKGGPMRFKVTSPEPFGVTLITDAARKDLMKGVKREFGTNDVLLTLNSKPPVFERVIKLAAGSYYFILENQSTKPVEFTLECYEVKPK
jgi:hypothetical protein